MFVCNHGVCIRPVAYIRLKFVVDELRQLSDSGVYESLALARINQADVQVRAVVDVSWKRFDLLSPCSFSLQEGAFHENFHIDLELSSEFLASGDATSRHKVVVMRDLEDDVLSFAIDEFPVMDEAAIEEHWVRKVQAKRAVREDAFDRMEAQWEAEHPTAAAGMEAARQAKLEKSMKSRLAYIARSLSSDHEEL